MTKSERTELAKAVRLLWDDQWEEAMQILLPMAGLRSPVTELVKEAKTVSILDLIKEKNT